MAGVAGLLAALVVGLLAAALLLGWMVGPHAVGLCRLLTLRQCVSQQPLLLVRVPPLACHAWARVLVMGL